MKLNRALPCLLALLLLLSAAGCSKTPDYTFTVSTDRYERELYKDDTAISLTVTTPADCTALTVSQLGGSAEIYAAWINEGSEAVWKAQESDPLCYTEALRTVSFSAETADITTEGENKIWQLNVDFGLEGVYGLLVTASTGKGEDISQKVPVYVRYPEINIVNEGVAAAWEAYILRNSDEPFFFIIDLTHTDMDYKNVAEITFWEPYSRYNGYASLYCSRIWYDPATYLARFGKEPASPWEQKFADGSPVYGEMPLFNEIPMDLFLRCRSFAGEMTDIEPIGEMACPTGAQMLCMIRETPRERIADSARVAVSYLHNANIDSEIYPRAALCLEKGSEALSEIITEGMSDFEKVKAIHDWMLEQGRNARYGEDVASSEYEQMDIPKCAYGFMAGCGADCMGWSDTFYMLCSMAGVCCSPVSCVGEPGGPTAADFTVNHRFNVAMLDGEIYYFDVYWDGAGSGYELPPYSYFCMTSSQAAKSHSWAAPEIVGPPEAVSTRYAVDAQTGELLSEP